MTRRNRTLVVVGLALLLASLASYGAYRAIQEIPVQQVPIATYHVVVAKAPLSVGTLVGADQVRLAAWPADAPVEGGFQTIDAVVGRGLTATVVKNEPITESKLASKKAGGGLAPLIVPGMRAVSVRVNDVIGVAGFVQPGSRVDVIVTVRAASESISRTVVSNVQVLAAGGNIAINATRGGEANRVAVVILLVTPADAEKITLAQSQGQIMLALRNPLDVEPAVTNGARMSGLVSAPNAEPERRVGPARPRIVAAPAPAPPPPPGPYTVETIRGPSRTQEVIK